MPADNVDITITHILTRTRNEIPEAIAILLKGSHVRGDAGPHSDIDLDVLVDTDVDVRRYVAWFNLDETSWVTHVSIAIKDLDSWLADADEPVSWSFGLPAKEVTRLLWAASEPLRATFDLPFLLHPAADPELEDFTSAFAKVRNALIRQDELGVRLAAQEVAQLCPTLLRLLNPEVIATSRRDALAKVLDFPVTPEGYAEAMLACLGLGPSARSTPEIADAARQLTLGTLDLLRPHVSKFGHLFEEGLSEPFIHGHLAGFSTQTR